MNHRCPHSRRSAPTGAARRPAAGIAIPGLVAVLLTLLALLAVTPPRARADCAGIDDPLQVLDFRLEMDPADWDVVRRDTRFETERPATFRCGDEAPLDVMVRRKRSDALPSDDDPVKVSLKVDFDDRIEDGEWHGHRKLSLESGIIRRMLPSALLREGVSWQILRRSGAISGAASWVRVHMNGRLLGVYTRVEEIDKSFLRRRIGEDDQFLYKFDPIDPDVGVHRRETREDDPDPILAGPAPVAPFPECGPGSLPEDEASCETQPATCAK